MDKSSAISRFLKRVDDYGQITLVTDKEVADLFGEELMFVLAGLESFACETQLCADCGGQCCDDIGCEFFSTKLARCPIHPLRPIACRLHFCHKFDSVYKTTIIELRDVFFGCYRSVDFSLSPNIASLDTPPFATHCPELVAGIMPLIEELRRGYSAPQNVAELVMKEAGRYRVTTTRKEVKIRARKR